MECTPAVGRGGGTLKTVVGGGGGGGAGGGADGERFLGGDAGGIGVSLKGGGTGDGGPGVEVFGCDLLAGGGRGGALFEAIDPPVGWGLIESNILPAGGGGGGGGGGAFAFRSTPTVFGVGPGGLPGVETPLVPLV